MRTSLLGPVLLLSAITGCTARAGFDAPLETLDAPDAPNNLGEGDGHGGDGSGGADGLGGGDGLDGDAVSFRMQYDREWIILARGMAMVPLTLDSSVSATYTITPTLPAGLDFDTTSGTISGSPQTNTELVPYMIQGSAPGFLAETQLRIGVLDGLFVDTTSDAVPLDPAGNGVCAPAGECSLRNAIAEANATSGSQVIVVPAGKHMLASTLPSVADAIIGVRDGISIIDFSENSEIGPLRVAIGNVAYLADLELRSGRSTAAAGACIYAAGSFHGSHLDVHDCGTTSRGAVVVEGSGALFIEASTFHDNQGGANGGAIECRGMLTVTTSSFTNNMARSGGAISLWTQEADITRSYFAGNQATDGNGGAIAISASTLSLMEANTFERNHASVEGGAVYLGTSESTISFSTFAQNTAPAGDAIALGSASVTLTGCLLLAQPNACSLLAGIVVSGGYNVLEGPLSTCRGLSRTSGDIGSADFGTGLPPDATNNGGLTPTIAIEPAGPASDVGTTLCSALDQRGEPRPRLAKTGTASCDAGAYEYQLSVVY